MGPTWDRQDPGVPHVGHVNLAIWDPLPPSHAAISRLIVRSHELLEPRDLVSNSSHHSDIWQGPRQQDYQKYPLSFRAIVQIWAWAFVRSHVDTLSEMVGTEPANHFGIISGDWFSIKMSSYQYRKSHCGDKTVVRSSYLHNWISYTGKMSSLYWIGAQETWWYWMYETTFILFQGNRLRYVAKPIMINWFHKESIQNLFM